MAQFQSMVREHPGLHLEFTRVLAERPFIVLHCLQRRSTNEEWVGIDIFRLDEAGQIVEHWDAIQRAPARSANDNPPF